MYFFILMAAIVAVIDADALYDPCPSCEYNKHGVGYTPNDYCNQFYKCQLKPGGGFEAILMCCSAGLVWNQYVLTCVPGDCYDEDYSDEDCTVTVDSTDSECYTRAHEDAEMYYIRDYGVWTEMRCAPGTRYVSESCGCIWYREDGINPPFPPLRPPCYDDPVLHFPFATHSNDIQCANAQGIKHGNAKVNLGMGALCLDGDGDYVEVPYLANWFNGLPGSFTVTMWFYQKEATSDAILPEAIFSNSDCTNLPTVFLGVMNTIIGGGMISPDSAATFLETDADASVREYTFGEWHHVAMRYDSDEHVVAFFYDGDLTSERDFTGPVKTSLGPATIGMAYYKSPHYFTGCIDDVMVFNRYVDNVDMKLNIFGRDRTNGTGEHHYVGPY